MKKDKKFIKNMTIPMPARLLLALQTHQLLGRPDLEGRTTQDSDC